MSENCKPGKGCVCLKDCCNNGAGWCICPAHDAAGRDRCNTLNGVLHAPAAEGPSTTEATPQSTPDLKAGDRVLVAGLQEPRVVRAVADGWVWCRRETLPTTAGGLIVRVIDCEKINPFFEPGKTYTRTADWSISAQGENVVETFAVGDVRTNGNGNRVAFGRVIAEGGRRPVDQWETKSQYEYDNLGWKLKED